MMRTLLLVSILFGLAISCSPDTKRLDEFVFHDDAGIKLKVVRYFRNLPLHYVGEEYAVMCQSENTRAFKEHEWQDEGWRTLGRGGALETKSAKDLVPELQKTYQVIGDGVLLWMGTVFQISLNACGRFLMWDPTRLPKEMIQSIPKPDYCAPVGTADCRYQDFEDDRKPVFSEVKYGAQGSVSFLVDTPALRPRTLHVRRPGKGKTWQVVPEVVSEDAYATERLSVHRVSDFDSSLPPTPLCYWLDQVLPADTQVVWSPTITDCGEQSGAGPEEDRPICVELMLATKSGEEGFLYFDLRTEKRGIEGKPEFFWGIYRSEEASHSIETLRDLPKAVAALSSMP